MSLTLEMKIRSTQDERKEEYMKNSTIKENHLI